MKAIQYQGFGGQCSNMLIFLHPNRGRASRSPTASRTGL